VPRRRIGLVDAAAALLLLWTSAGLVQEVVQAARGRESDPRLFPSGWLLGGPQVEPLRRSLGALGHRLPRGAIVAVDSLHWDRDQLHYLTMWCAYYLPRQNVVHRELLAAEGGAAPAYVVTLPPRDELPGGRRLELPVAGGEAPPFSVHRLEREPDATVSRP
jgi:hypothetical protein